MSTISTATNRNSNPYIITALAITFVVVLSFTIASAIVAPKPAFVPVTGSQNAYVDFLHGEKQVFANSVGLGAAFSMYLAGEKALNMKAVDANNTLWVYRLGEKSFPAGIESVLLQYRLAEKSTR